MNRTITLTEGTQTLINAILNLEKASDSVFSLIRSETTDEYDETGYDILDATNKLRDVYEKYLLDRFNFAMTESSNIDGAEALV